MACLLKLDNAFRLLRDSTNCRSPADVCYMYRYLSWDDYFMSVAFLSAQRSKDPNKQVTVYLWVSKIACSITCSITLAT